MKRITKYYIVLLMFFISGSTFGQSFGSIPMINQKLVNENVQINPAKAINSKDTEFSPAWYKSGFVFVAKKNKRAPFFQHYYAPIINQEPSSRIDFVIDSDTALHEGPLCFNEQQNVAYFTRSNVQAGTEESDQSGKVRLQLFEAIFKNKKWSEVRHLPFNSKAYSVCHPTLDEENNRLYFASDMPGGYGAYDLYYCEKIEGQWSDPVNLGEDVNSAQNDAFPFFHATGKMFFSSERKNGLGGYDLYLCDLKSDLFRIPFLLPVPFNSKFDDIGLILDRSTQFGFFTSNRVEGKGQDDIFSISSEVPLLTQTKSTFAMLPMNVANQLSKKGINNAEVKLSLVPYAHTLTDNMLEERINTETNEISISLKEEFMQAVKNKTNKSGGFNQRVQIDRKYIVEIKHPDFHTYKKIKTFTKDDFNLTFFLDEKDCDKWQFIVVDEMGNELNREGVVIKNGCDTEIDNWTSTSCIKNNCDQTIVIIKEGFEDKQIFIPKNKIEEWRNEKVAIRILKKVVPSKVVVEKQERKIKTLSKQSVLKAGELLILENIYYDYNDDELNTDAKEELDHLAQLMQGDALLKIELSSHTDSQGDSKYNQKLSDKRALNVFKYLKDKGIDKTRIISIGFGESRLRNHCADNIECSEFEHQQNRRTELKILSSGN